MSSLSPPGLSRPWLIAHRGASALRPEHTLAAYALAIEQGADAIEPDLVATRDGILVARHENALSDSTDVALHSAFAARRTRKRIDGRWVEDWFTEDFSLAELRTLRAVERLPLLRSTRWDGQFAVPTFDEVLALAASASAAHGRRVGVVPEIKHSTYFSGLGLPLEPRLLAALASNPQARGLPVVIQSFETANLRALRERLPRGGDVRLLQLLGEPTAAPFDTVQAGRPKTYAQWAAPEGLAEIATHADAIGLHQRLLRVEATDTEGGYRSALADAAHAAGLAVFAYTFRPERVFIEEAFRGDGAPGERDDAGAIRQLRAHAAAGVDALFVDDPGLARRAWDPEAAPAGGPR